MCKFLKRYSSSATILSNLITIDGPASRSALIAKLPQTASGNTCIDLGLLKGLEVYRFTKIIITQMKDITCHILPNHMAQVLKSGGEGGIIILMTDGEQNCGGSNISYVIPNIVQSGARVITIAFGYSLSLLCILKSLVKNIWYWSAI